MLTTRRISSFENNFIFGIHFYSLVFIILLFTIYLSYSSEWYINHASYLRAVRRTEFGRALEQWIGCWGARHQSTRIQRVLSTRNPGRSYWRYSYRWKPLRWWGPRRPWRRSRQLRDRRLIKLVTDENNCLLSVCYFINLHKPEKK